MKHNIIKPLFLLLPMLLTSCGGTSVAGLILPVVDNPFTFDDKVELTGNDKLDVIKKHYDQALAYQTTSIKRTLYENIRFSSNLSENGKYLDTVGYSVKETYQNASTYYQVQTINCIVSGEKEASKVIKYSYGNYDSNTNTYFYAQDIKCHGKMTPFLLENDENWKLLGEFAKGKYQTTIPINYQAIADRSSKDANYTKNLLKGINLGSTFDNAQVFSKDNSIIFSYPFPNYEEGIYNGSLYYIKDGVLLDEIEVYDNHIQYRIHYEYNVDIKVNKDTYKDLPNMNEEEFDKSKGHVALTL